MSRAHQQGDTESLPNFDQPSVGHSAATEILLKPKIVLLNHKMAKKALAKDQFVKLIVGAGQASPSPPVGPALGSKGVKSMDFCKVGLFRI